jgi:N-acetyl-gamma-glutamyl-phosphate reductase
LADADLVFLALPHGESASLASVLPDDVAIVDLGADFRLEAPEDWDTYYGGSHAGTWTYGIPELFRSAILEQRRIANPGCYATSVALALHPLLAAELVEPEDIVVVAASGTSGAGRTPSEALLATEVMGSMSAYKVGGIHQHTPEMEQTLATAAEGVRLNFTPLLAPMPRGIIATCTARTVGRTSTDALRDALHESYANEPFVHVLPAGQWPRTGSTLGSNAVHLQVAADAHSGRAVVVAALDNLVKGAAGQAVQNANLILGQPETAGLSSIGVAP